jgi:hypothetical protein
LAWAKSAEGLQWIQNSLQSADVPALVKWGARTRHGERLLGQAIEREGPLVLRSAADTLKMQAPELALYVGPQGTQLAQQLLMPA